MSYQYDQYLVQHKANVKKGLDWIQENLPDLIKGTDNIKWLIEFAHDQSKSDPDEYAAYDEYFYGGNRSFAVVQAFNSAWLSHIHRNPHHWQHWVLIHDDPNEPEECIEIPYQYLIEMICDWWSFSWNQGDLKEVFSWWDKHKDYIKLHKNSRQIIISVLSQIKSKLEEQNDQS